eukprot:8450494-Pyramimonas_sp.AAC.1
MVVQYIKVGTKGWYGQVKTPKRASAPTTDRKSGYAVHKARRRWRRRASRSTPPCRPLVLPSITSCDLVLLPAVGALGGGVGGGEHLVVRLHVVRLQRLHAQLHLALLLFGELRREPLVHAQHLAVGVVAPRLGRPVELAELVLPRAHRLQ